MPSSWLPLYLAKGVLVPLTLAVLLSFFLSPVCDWLERRRLGRISAVLESWVSLFKLELTEKEIDDLAHYLKSL